MRQAGGHWAQRQREGTEAPTGDKTALPRGSVSLGSKKGVPHALLLNAIISLYSKFPEIQRRAKDLGEHDLRALASREDVVRALGTTYKQSIGIFGMIQRFNREKKAGKR